MKTSILTLAIALAFSLSPVPADALSSVEKCNVFRAKVEMNFSRCMKRANVLEEKGKTADRARCNIRHEGGIAKVKAKFVEKMQVAPADCGLEKSSTNPVKALDILASGQELHEHGLRCEEDCEGSTHTVTECVEDCADSIAGDYWGAGYTCKCDPTKPYASLTCGANWGDCDFDVKANGFPLTKNKACTYDGDCNTGTCDTRTDSGTFGECIATTISDMCPVYCKVPDKECPLSE